MKIDISNQIVTLSSLNRAQLLPIWADNFSTDPPPKLRKELMVPILAYRIQERQFGGLSHNARKQLQEIARTLPSKRLKMGEAKTVNTAENARFIRLWRGEIHEVVCLKDGFEYKGRRFTSLSRIAREITGTQWSGPVFFGTKEKKAK